MRRRTARTLAITTLTTAAVAVPAAGAAAAERETRLAGLPLPDAGQVLADLTGTTTIGGILTDATTQLEATIDAVLEDVLAGSALGQILGPSAGGGGDAGGLLPADALESLLLTLGIPTVKAPAPGEPVVIDARAPGVTVKLRTTKLRNTGRDGRLKLLVTSDEPGVVMLRSAIRPGKARARRFKESHSRKLIRVPAVTLGFKRAGSLKVTIKLSRGARRTLNRARDMRMSVAMVAADAAQNQEATRVKRRLTR